MSDRMPEDMPDIMPEGMPERMPDKMSDRMPEDMPDRMPEDVPDRMPDRMPEDLPALKRINFMVGITRSKVITRIDASYTFSFLFETFLTSFENKVYGFKRLITPLRHAEKQWNTSMTFHDHKLACYANRYRMQRRCRAKKFLGKATSLKKLLSPPINLLLSVWYMYGPGKKCMDEICPNSEIMYVYHI